ncbi:hypothetical protein LJC33_07120 [Eubacteriales bacterium OttesenSCG-928-N13]|nr:hypothetical protein [Eubacteriales bacterium OttesenSCG-928-N13]
MIATYEQFIERVNALGVMAFSHGFPDGFPTLEQMTTPQQWHTGEVATDPWQWKDRAAAEQKLAFGCILGGHKGFISRAMYPLFYAAMRPRESLQARYEDGTVSSATLQIYQLFEDRFQLSTADIRSALGVTKKQGASRADGAVIDLQKQFLITVNGNQRRINKDGQPYGWPANTYTTVERWTQDWIDENPISAEEARAQILAHCEQLDPSIDLGTLRRRLFGRI